MSALGSPSPLFLASAAAADTAANITKSVRFNDDDSAYLNRTPSSAGNRKGDLLIDSLVERVKKENIEEVILATSATIEGQTTAYYIQESLKNSKVKVTKLAQGLPVGGEIESLDDGTLFSAFKNRSKLNSNYE